MPRLLPGESEKRHLDLIRLRDGEAWRLVNQTFAVPPSGEYIELPRAGGIVVPDQNWQVVLLAVR